VNRSAPTTTAELYPRPWRSVAEEMTRKLGKPMTPANCRMQAIKALRKLRKLAREGELGVLP
jgi:hypothetical protein